MKNIVLKFYSIFILLGVVFLPFSALGFKSQVPVELTTIIEESTTIVEETTVSNIKMVSTFEDKLAMIQVNCDKELDESTTVQVIEEKTTRQEKTQTPSTTIKTAIETTTEKKETKHIEQTEECTTKAEIIQSSKYDVAAQIWNLLHSIGCNDYASAGILGNIMSECGGHTLDLQWWACSGSYYGLCQWYYEYFPSVWKADLATQLNFLKTSIPNTFNSYGHIYAKGFNVKSFANINDIEAATIAFAKCYERCASWTYNSRVNNAYKAYHYFCS